MINVILHFTCNSHFAVMLSLKLLPQLKVPVLREPFLEPVNIFLQETCSILNGGDLVAADFVRRHCVEKRRQFVPIFRYAFECYMYL